MKTAIIAHRGASKIAPENTMPAFKLASKIGADGIETDVQLTKDNIPILIHDETLKRTTNGQGYVKDFTCDELKQLDAGAWFSDKYVGTQILTLEQFLKWAQKENSFTIHLELKTNIIEYKHIESLVLEQIKHFNLENNTIISSFNPQSIKQMGHLTTKVETALLLSQRTKKPLDYVKQIGADGLHIRYSLLTKRLVEESNQHTIPIRVYTVNRPTQLMRCYKWKCNGLFTDVPHTAMEYQQVYNFKNQ
ncbi:glycerophosphodiester phosphodiesterase [Pontibacillus litoralis]|uniref:Glycerophosphodiester phosphodiesterase n=1 Tax=Pontibacillus litoralis JSM 072002 TaxID=1385512 RepID=A0A0A5FYW1_9BACI|nr:glycerophosphodiester phosphodiesterase [Pontibacillus litoralis]KGX86006.1 glycerophosphodiester phosphodiesterase [Pontibacillus litoralis JSM 072002]